MPTATTAPTVDPANLRKPAQRGRVVALMAPGRDHGHHESVTQRHIAREAAALLGYTYAGEHDGVSLDWPSYAVPQHTLLADEADALGIRSDADLLGGVVPHAFVAGKTITHGLVSTQAESPEGWAFDLARDLGDAVLEGYAAFSRADARTAAQ
ncbi:MAG: DUF3182 family protein, partial [Dokdonella sp.]|uniref:DUF3182 family protein n=1 Tax=Dokdonella sp. TaxID=2291710 RepID=UPI003F7D41C2